jgi:molybdopterin converting factor small subunit
VPIHLTLNLGPVVRERAGRGQRRVRVETEATTPAALLRELGVADLGDDLLVVVNHAMVTDEHAPLKDGDEVGLYLPLEGG